MNIIHMRDELGGLRATTALAVMRSRSIVTLLIDESQKQPSSYA